MMPRFVIYILASIIALGTASCFNSTTTPPPTSTLPPSPTLIKDKSLVVRVFDDVTQDPVSQANVVFLPEENPGNFQTKVTDGSGLVRFADALNKDKMQIRITVSNNEYQTFDKSTTIDRDNPLFDVFLTPKSGAAKLTDEPTDEPTPTPTDEATIEPTEEPAIEPTDTPTPTKEPTAKPTNTPTPKSTPIPPTPVPPSRPTGKIAIPLGGPKVYIADTDGNFLGRLDMARQPDFTSDGKMLVVNGEGGPLDKLRTSDSVGNNQEEIGDPGLGGHSHPVWSPDGAWVMYDDNTLGCQGYCLYRRDLNNRVGEGELIRAAVGPIVGANALYPQWTTGDRIVFRSCKTWTGQGGECGTWVMQGNGGEPEQLTNNANHIFTDIHEDIAVFVTNEPDGGDDWDIYTVDIETKEITRLTNDSFANGLATISPDGRWVAFVSNRDGKAVWYIDINGGTPQRMFNIPPDWGDIAQDAWFNDKLSWGQ